MLQCCQCQYSIKDMHTFQFEYNTHCGSSIRSWEIFFPQHQMSSPCHTLVVAKQPAHSVFADTAEHHHVTYHSSYGHPAAAVIWVECCSFSLATFSFFKYEFFEYNTITYNSVYIWYLEATVFRDKPLCSHSVLWSCHHCSSSTTQLAGRGPPEAHWPPQTK